MGNNFLRYGCRQLTRFGNFQDRIMKLSGWTWFIISWSLSKFVLISTTFFHSFQGGPDKRKNAKRLQIGFSAFFLRNNEKKSCRNELKFWEASRNHKSSLSWKCHNSILKKAKTSRLSASISEKVVPLVKILDSYLKWMVDLLRKMIEVSKQI